MRFAGTLLIVPSVIALLSSGCMSVRDGGLFLSAPASSNRVRDGEEALAHEQAQRQAGDRRLTVDLGKAEEGLRDALADSESRIRADVNTALQAYESDPQGAIALLRQKMTEAAARSEQALVGIHERDMARVKAGLRSELTLAPATSCPGNSNGPAVVHTYPP